MTSQYLFTMNYEDPDMYQSKPSIEIQEDSSESDDSDDGEEEEIVKGRKISMSSFGNPLNDER